MNKPESMLEALGNFEESLTKGKNNDVTKHAERKIINTMTQNKDYSKTKISDRRIGD